MRFILPLALLLMGGVASEARAQVFVDEYATRATLVQDETATIRLPAA